MHLQHGKELKEVRVYRESRSRRLGLAVFLFVFYGVSIWGCIVTSGKPYARALEQGRLLDIAGDQKLKDKAALYTAQEQRKLAEKLAEAVADSRQDEESKVAAAESTNSTSDEAPKKKKSEARRKAELALERAAKVAEAMVQAAARGENITEDEVKRKLFGDEEVELEAAKDEERPLPSKYLPDAWACLLLLSIMTLHALFWLMCHWVVIFKARALYLDSSTVNNKCHLLIIPHKHKGRAALVPVKSAKLGGGLVVEYQRQLYEYWGPDDEEDDDMSQAAEDPWKKKNMTPAEGTASGDDGSNTAEGDGDDDDDDDDDDEEEEVIEFIDEDEEVVGLGKANGSLRRISPPLRLSISHYASLISGLDARQAAVATERYGRNLVQVKVPSFVELYKEQLLSPISMFQVFTSLLWLLDAYWQYVGFTLFSIVFMEAGTVMQRQRTLKSLSGMSAQAAPLYVKRDGVWKLLQSDDLLPGDVVSLSRQRGKTKKDDKAQDNDELIADDDDQEDDKKKNKKTQQKKRNRARIIHTVPCDCLLLRGSAVANEATLTGESTPQMKDAIQDEDTMTEDDEARPLEMHDRDRVSVLFAGTELVHATCSADVEDHSTSIDGAPPDDGAVAVVLRTGFASAQGELMQMIEFSQQTVSSDTRETLLALLVLLVFALISAAYVLKRGLEKGDRTTHELLLRCVIIVTSVVPRQLPMQMALAVNTALMALMKNGIMATEPFRVPFAGRVKHCLFDKTGTLTTDRLSPVGVVSNLDTSEKTNAASRAESGIDPVNQASDLASIVIAGCHALVAAEEEEQDDDKTKKLKNNEEEQHKLVGDSIELTALRALGWDYDPKSGVALPPKTLAQQKKRGYRSLRPSRVRILGRHHFSSALQRMSVLAEVYTNGEIKRAALVKGSPEAVRSLLAQGTAPAWYESTYSSLAESGMRVLALAYKWMPPASKNAELPTRPELESDLSFAGFIAFECKTRADSEVVCRALADSAHRVAMVTGDAPLTALHVARSTRIANPEAPALVLASDESAPLGAAWKSPYTPPRCQPRPLVLSEVPALASEYALVVTESALAEAAAQNRDQSAPLTASMRVPSATAGDVDDDESHLELKAARERAEDEVWFAAATSACVFARCSPQGKARLCRSLQRLEGTACVLMCGDGGNDVGALKQADVGLALLAGYGEANTTTDGGYADVGAKLAQGRALASSSNDDESNAEDILNAQAEALAEARARGADIRKQTIAAKQKELMGKQQEWLQEELARRAERGDTGMGAQFGAVKSVALRLRKEMAKEIEKIDAQLGSAYDNKDVTDANKSAADQVAELLGGGAGGGEDPNALPMIRPGDASVAAPFTSRAPSIRAVVDLIRQGRCTLLSSLQQQQIMCLESIISAYTLAALSLEGARSSERQMMASGWLLIVASLAFSYATPLEKMAPVRPLSSLADYSVVVSILGQGAIHIFCMRQAVKLATDRMGPAALDAVVNFQRRARAGEVAAEEVDEDDIMAWFTSIWSTPFLPNLLNTSVFLVETSQMVAVMLVNYKGRPWMKGMLENHALFLSLFLAVAGLVLCAWGFVPEANAAIHLAEFPDDTYRFKIVGLVGASLVGTFIWDRISTALFAPHIFKAQVHEARTTTLADLSPVFTTAAKVAIGVLLLVQGNILVLGGAVYFYRQYSQKMAQENRERKSKLVQLATAKEQQKAPTKK